MKVDEGLAENFKPQPSPEQTTHYANWRKLSVFFGFTAQESGFLPVEEIGLRRCAIDAAQRPRLACPVGSPIPTVSLPVPLVCTYVARKTDVYGFFGVSSENRVWHVVCGMVHMALRYTIAQLTLLSLLGACADNASSVETGEANLSSSAAAWLDSVPTTRLNPGIINDSYASRAERELKLKLSAEQPAIGFSFPPAASDFEVLRSTVYTWSTLRGEDSVVVCMKDGERTWKCDPEPDNGWSKVDVDGVIPQVVVTTKRALKKAGKVSLDASVEFTASWYFGEHVLFPWCSGDAPDPACPTSGGNVGE